MCKSFQFFLFITLLFYGCTNPPYRGSDVLGADEFVIDSYKIREGKFSILEMQGSPVEELSPSLLEEQNMTIQNGDTLKIVLFHPTHKDLMEAVGSMGQSVGYEVRKGMIHLPDIGPLNVEHLTLDEAREKIQAEYLKQIRDVEIFVTYQNPKKKVELIGLVHEPSVMVDGKVRLYEVLSKTRIPPEANLFMSYLVRDGHPIPVDMHRLVRKGDMTQNVVMAGGDKLYIAPPQASMVMVMGEVGKQGVIDLPAGFMPLRQVIALSGGIQTTGDKRYIQVIRGNILRPKIYTLNWQHVSRLPTDSLLVMSGDVVYIAATPVAEWNRFINQLFPTFTVIELFTKGVSGVVAVE